MSDTREDLPSILGKPGEPVAEVDPDDLKTFWQEIRYFQARDQARDPSQHVSFGIEAKAIAKPVANFEEVWYRSMMLRILTEEAQEQFAPWIKDEEVSDVVFRTMATIPMEWIGNTEREGLPFDVEEFFRRLREGGVQNSRWLGPSVPTITQFWDDNSRQARFEMWRLFRRRSRVW